eukprot:6604111-Pyramimonas_sp.AAC.1
MSPTSSRPIHNSNQGKQTLKKRLSCTKSLIVLAQEIGYQTGSARPSAPGAPATGGTSWWCQAPLRQ